MIRTVVAVANQSRVGCGRLVTNAAATWVTSTNSRIASTVSRTVVRDQPSVPGIPMMFFSRSRTPTRNA